MRFAIVGLPCTGKSTILKALLPALGEKARGFFENSEQMFFQEPMRREPNKFALLNQVDFFLHKAKWELTEERHAQEKNTVDIFDTVIDWDFYVYSSYFKDKFLITKDEFEVLQRLYASFRAHQTPPKLIVLTASPDTLTRRLQKRGKTVELVTEKMLFDLQKNFQHFVERMKPNIFITINNDVDAQNLDLTVQRIKTAITNFE